MTRAEIIERARTFVGLPWRHQGRTAAGLDCVGLVIAVGSSFGLPYEDKTGYGRHALSHEFMHHLRRYLVPLPPSAARLATIGVFREARFPCHVGIFSERDGVETLINSRANRRRVVEEAFATQSDPLQLVEILAFPGMAG
jgi:hypothetical protein